MNNLSVLIGGKAGFGIDTASSLIAYILNQLGLRIYIYRDYPSLIRGGHTFSIVRASSKKIASHQDKIDFLLALNQDTLNLHKSRIKNDAVIIYDSDTVKLEGLSTNNIKTIGIPLTKIINEEHASEIMRNSCIIGSFCKAAGIEWVVLEKTFNKHISKEKEANLKIAQRGFNEARELAKIEKLSQDALPILSGNEALALGLIKGGLKAYVAYPMTPSSAILHFMARMQEGFSLKAIHPESEIAVILMALGFAYAGEKVAVGTSGGGFCLMAEGLSFSGMSELPVVIILGQRTGPSTGLPTYTGQTELHFALNAGQGEFTRLLIAPGDAEEAYQWATIALNLSWKYQIPSIILTDKTLAEGNYSFDIDSIVDIKEEALPLWDRNGQYKRYLDTSSGASALTFVPDKDAVIKINSYEHDEFGITTEDPVITKKMQEKRLRKEKYLLEDLNKYEPVKVYGDKNASETLVCWGSNKGVCIEVAEKLGLKVIQPVALWPFPVEEFRKTMQPSKKFICIENNATGQLARLVNSYGFKIDRQISKYDGRPFSVEELEEELKK